jgi:O-antigen/teichoic acid export membrane protein
LKTVYASSVKYTVLIVVPATLAMVVLSQPLIGTLYGNKWPFAPFLLSLSVLYNLLSLFGWRSYPSLLQAMDETRLIMYLNLLSLIISVPLAFYLVPAFGIVGIVAGIPGSAIPSTFIGIYLTWKRYGVKANLWSSAKILVASTLATAATYAFLFYVTAPYVVLLAVGAVIFLFVYLFSAPIVGAISLADVYSLRSMFSNSSISRILEIPLKLIEKILKVIKREK